MLSHGEFNRKTPEQYLHEYKGDNQVFPALFDDLLYPLFRECMSLEGDNIADRRIELVLKQYGTIMRGRERKGKENN